MHILTPKIDIPYQTNTNDKIYDLEICLLIKSNNEHDFLTWLDWHFNYIKIDHLWIYDNGCTFNLREAVKPYSDKVRITKVEGTPHQADIYTNHVRNISKAKFVLPIDDDEFIFSNVDFKTYLQTMKLPKFALRSLLMVPKDPVEKRGNENIFQLCDHFVLQHCRENREVKCVLNTEYSHFYFDVKRYEDATRQPNGYADWRDEQISPDDQINDKEHNIDFNYTLCGNVHNPITTDEAGNRIPALDIYLNDVHGFLSPNTNTPGEIFLAHMKVRTKEEWDWKCNVRKVVADMQPGYYDSQYRLYDDIYKAERQKFTGFLELYK